MNSTRLPGKVLKEINGLPLIVHIYRRMLACKELDEVIIAWGGPSEPIEAVMNKFGISSAIYYQTDEDLISRFGCATFHARASAFLRATSDCLFHDPKLIDELVGAYRMTYPRYRGIANSPQRRVSEGLDAEIFSTELLAELDRTKDCPRESFAQWVIERGKKYKVAQLNVGVLENAGTPHLSIDTQEDFDRAEKMLKILSNDEWRYEKTLEAYRQVMNG